MRDAPAAHPTFLLDAAGSVALPVALPDGVGDEVLWHALSHRVMRRPTALADHVRRLRLCRRPVLAPRAAGALADLLHALDGCGAALAQRMLVDAASGLAPADRELLTRWIAGEAPSEAARQRLPGSVLPTLGSRLAAPSARPPAHPARTGADA